MITEELMLLKEEFKRIKDMGYVKGTRGGTTGIGKTFEDLLGKKEDTLDKPDFHGIEIKTKRTYSRAYTTLFNAEPKGKKEDEAKRLKDKYGYPDSVLKQFKVLNVSVQANCNTSVGGRFLFKLDVDKEAEKIYLLIHDKNLIFKERRVYWDFSTLRARLERKLPYLALIKAWTTNRDGVEYYKYYDINFYKLKTFEDFLKLIEDGTIRITFHLGIYRIGERKGKIRDHGTCFEIQELDMDKLFEKIEL